MKLNKKESALILSAVNAFRERFGPLSPGEKPDGYAECVKELHFAAQTVEAGEMPVVMAQAISVETAVKWFCQAHPDLAEEFSALLATIKLFIETHQFTE